MTEPTSQLTAAAQACSILAADNARLREALELVLLFYNSTWDEKQRDKWWAITGKDEATTKVMCDHIRAALAAVVKP